MAQLSSNWKNLSKKLKAKPATSDKSADKEKSKSIGGPKGEKGEKVEKLIGNAKGKVGGKITKPTKTKTKPTTTPTTTKEVNHKSNKSKLVIPGKNIVTSIRAIAKANERSIGPLEATLWNNDNEISEQNIVRGPQDAPDRTKNRKTHPGKYLAMDCEFVGIGEDGKESALARVSIVNFYGYVIYDTFVKPKEVVTDWRTWVSGVTAKDMASSVSFEEAQKKVASLLEGKILVGHAVNNDLDSLFLSHPKLMIRDTSKFAPYKEIAGGKHPSLKKLTEHFVKINIQEGSHSSVEDARATMLLFRLRRREFENQPNLKFHFKD